MAMAGLIFSACSQDDLVSNVAKGDGNVHITVKLPESYASRAGAVAQFSKGYVATELNYAVYDGTSGNLVLQGLTQFEETSLELDLFLNLARNKSYDIAFLAQSPESMNTANTGDPSNGVYDFDADGKTVTVNYNNMSSDNNLADAYDCFYKVINTGEIEAGGLQTEATLIRPVAQINWGTSDLLYTDDQNNQSAVAHEDAYGSQGQYIVTTLQTNAYTTLNLLTGAVSGQSAVTLDALAAPYTLTFPLDETAESSDPDAPAIPVAPQYVYVAMQYVLAPTAGTNYNLNLSISNSGNENTASPVTTGLEIASVPVQANFRTNIYGDLLSEDVAINVKKSPIWNEPDYDWPVGQMVANGLVYDEANNTYTIMNTNGMVAYANLVNSGGVTAGATAMLGADLNMSGVNYTPFSNAGLIFDGQNHTISNLTVRIASGNGSAGFMTSAGTASNINFTNANITGNYKAGVLAGDGLCAVVDNISVTNSHVVSTPWRVNNNSPYDDGNNVGLIIGYLSAEPDASITNCTVTNSTVVGFRKVGGITGIANLDLDTYPNGVITVTGNTVENCYIVADLATNYYGPTTSETPNLVGAIASNGYTENNTESNNQVVIIAPQVDGQIQISSVEDLQNLAYSVNSGRSYSGQNVVLTQSLDLNNQPWTPIGKSGYTFSGKFDGGNNTISNLYINNPNSNYQGLFGYTTNGSVSNLILNNVNITGLNGVGAVAGSPYTSTYTNITVQGDVTINGFSYVGGVAGYNAYAAFNNVVVNCNTEKSYVKANSIETNGDAYRTYVGGIVGFFGEGNNANQRAHIGLKSNIDVYGTTMDVGGIAGIAHYGLSFTDCECSGNIYITQATSQLAVNQVGGITGTWMSSGNVSFTNCSFTGTLNSNLEPSIGTEAWNERNAITGGAYSTSTAGTLLIDGQDVSAEHGYSFPTTDSGN